MRAINLMGFWLVCLSALGSAAAAVPPDSAGDQFVIQSSLFRGLRNDRLVLPRTVVIVKSFSDPVFLPAPPTSFAAAEAELSFETAMRTEIGGVFKLSSVEPLSSAPIYWDGKKESLREAIVLDGALYPITYRPKALGGSRFGLRIEIARHAGLSSSPGFPPADPAAIDSAWTEGEKIMDTEMSMRLNEPLVLGFPTGDHAYFLSLRIRKATSQDRPGDLGDLIVDGETVKPTGFYLPPRPRTQITPAYPAACKDAQIEGKVVVFVKTDKDGKVESARIWRKAHPELDKSAIAALSRWTFEPVLDKGRPVPSVFFMTVEYSLPLATPAPDAAGKAKPPERETKGKMELHTGERINIRDLPAV